MRLWARLFHRNINKGKIVLIAMICIVALTLTACAASGDCDSANTNNEIGSSVVGVETGSICDLDLSERGYNLRRYETIADLYNVLQEDLVDYVAIEEDTGECFLERDSSFVSLGETGAVEHLGIIIGNVDNQAQLKTRIDDFLISYMASDEYTELKQRWLSGGSANASMPEYANEGNEVLKVGVSADVEPFVYVDSEGELAGFDIELALRLGQALGMHVEFVEGDYAGLFPASESGRVDVVISAVPITEEREERYVFSEPYLEESTIFLARDKSVAAATDNGTDTSFFAQVGESV